MNPSALVRLVLCCSFVTASAHAATVTELFGFPCTNAGYTCPDGADPDSLILASDGNFYGTTFDSRETSYGRATGLGGTVFKLTPSGQFTLLYTFQSNAQGHYPNGEAPSSLVEGPDGGWGSVYSITVNGALLQTIYFNGTEGTSPDVLLQGKNGDLYGETYDGGKDSTGKTAFGVVFSINAGLPPPR